MRVRRSLLLLFLTLSMPLLARSTEFASASTLLRVPHAAAASRHGHFTELQGSKPVRASAQALPLVVDGSRAPNLVPHHVATRFFIFSLAHPARQEAIANRLRLGAADRASLSAAISSLPEQLRALDERRKALRSGTPETNATRAALKSDEDVLLDTTYVKLLGSLSPSAATAVAGYIETRIKGRLKGFSMAKAIQQ